MVKADISHALSNARNVLFMSHLALGDYLYQRSFLVQLCQQYPHIQLDIWFDDFRRKSKIWSQGRTDIMGKWLEQESFVRDHFPIAPDSDAREAMIRDASTRKYDVVIVLASSRPGQFYNAARRIAPDAFCIGLKPKKLSLFSDFLHVRKMDKLVEVAHTSAPPILSLYAERFSKLGGFKAKPVLAGLEIPAALSARTLSWLDECKQVKNCDKALLINTVSTTPKRDYSWKKMERVLVELNRLSPKVLLVINAPPHQRTVFEQRVDSLSQNGIPAVCFTADSSVFEIAAMVGEVDAVLSVETAIMHFAEVMKTPQVVMIRRQTSHWQPAHANGVIISDKYVDSIKENQIVETCQQYLLPFLSGVTETDDGQAL